LKPIWINQHAENNHVEVFKTNRIQHSPTILDDNGITNLDSIDFSTPESWFSGRAIRGSTLVQGGIEPADAQFAAPRGELQRKETTGYVALAEEVLEDARHIKLAHALETHSHYAVSGKRLPVQNRQPAVPRLSIRQGDVPIKTQFVRYLLIDYMNGVLNEGGKAGDLQRRKAERLR
jgi:hypothetical protein